MSTASSSEAAGNRCANCNDGPVDHYCASCGQRCITAHDLTLAGFFHDSIHELTSFDGRLGATLKALVMTPGLLGEEYFAGRGGRYMKPLSLFVLMNLIFFIIQPHTGLLGYDLAGYIGVDSDVATQRRDQMNVRRLDIAMREQKSAGSPQPVAVEPFLAFRVRFDTELQDLKKSMLIVSIPLFAVGMAVIFAGGAKRFAEHLVFSVHVYAFFLLFAGVFVSPAFFLLFWLLRQLRAPASMFSVLGGEPVLVALIFVVMSSYIALGLRRMYGGQWPVTILRGMVLCCLMQFLFVACHHVLFWATLASL